MALVNVPFCSQSMWRALELCNSLKRKLQIRGNLWLSPSRISPTFEAGVTRDELFEEKASWLLSILYGFFWRSIALHQLCKTCYWSFTTSLLLYWDGCSCWESVKHIACLFSAQGHFASFPSSAVWKSHLHYKDTTASAVRGLHLHDTYMQISIVSVISVIWAQQGANILRVSQRKQKVRRELFHNSLVNFFYETFVHTRPYNKETPLPLFGFFASSLDVDETLSASVSPLHIPTSVSYLWYWPTEADNCKGATINCLLCGELTCLYLLGSRWCLGTRW